MLEIKSAEFSFTAVDERGFERSNLPEIALVGRSNVGKSSLINTLCARKALARVSATPGKTREINYYLLNNNFYLVDLPGYGYAQVSKVEQQRWAKMIEGYFSSSPRIKLVLLLMDIRREPNDDDCQMVQWAEHNGLDYAIVATKSDKVNRSQRAIACRQLSDKLQCTFRQQAVCFSVTEGLGRAELLRAIEAALK